MTPITLQGIRLLKVDVEAPDSDGKRTVGCEYALISSADKVLAKQRVGSYGGMEVTPSADTLAKLDTFMQAFQNDISRTIGLPVT